MTEFKGEKCVRITKNGEVVLRKTKEWADYQRRVKISDKLHKANLWFIEDYKYDDSFGEETKDNIIKLQKYADEFKNKYIVKSLFFYGVHNTQKTICAGILGKEIIKKGFSCFYIYGKQIVDILYSFSFFKEKTQEEINIYNKIRSVDFLIIDRLFEKVTWTVKQLSYIDSFLSHRSEIQKKATCIISLFSLSELAKIYSDIEPLIKRNFYQMNFVDVVDQFDINSMFS